MGKIVAPTIVIAAEPEQQLRAFLTVGLTPPASYSNRMSSAATAIETIPTTMAATNQFWRTAASLSASRRTYGRDSPARTEQA